MVIETNDAPVRDKIMLDHKLKNRNLIEPPPTPLPGLGFLEFLGEGVMVLDSDRQVIMVNSALENLLGWTGEELTGQPCFRFFGCHHPGTGTSLCQNLCPLMFLQAATNSRQPVQYQ